MRLTSEYTHPESEETSESKLHTFVLRLPIRDRLLIGKTLLKRTEGFYREIVVNRPRSEKLVDLWCKEAKRCHELAAVIARVTCEPGIPKRYLWELLSQLDLSIVYKALDDHSGWIMHTGMNPRVQELPANSHDEMTCCHALMADIHNIQSVEGTPC